MFLRQYASAEETACAGKSCLHFSSGQIPSPQSRQVPDAPQRNWSGFGERRKLRHDATFQIAGRGELRPVGELVDPIIEQENRARVARTLEKLASTVSPAISRLSKMAGLDRAKHHTHRRDAVRLAYSS